MITLPGPVVDADWLATHLGRGREPLVVADVRWYLGVPGGGGRAAYDGGHLPGAVFVDLDHDLSAPAAAGAGRHPLPAPEVFAAAMGRLGIGDGIPVVAYDDTGGGTAARLWWMLDSLGHPAAVLDGGIGAWSGPLETAATAPDPAIFTPRPWPRDRFADADEVDRLRTDPSAVVLDARARPRYLGEDAAVDPVAGHVPGALSAPWSDNLVDGRLAPIEQLRSRYEAVGATGAAEVVAYCGSGVTACHDLLALAVLGVRRLRLYPGSWSGWSTQPGRPVATGPEP